MTPDLFFSLLSGQVLHTSASELGMMFSKCPPLTFSAAYFFHSAGLDFIMSLTEKRKLKIQCFVSLLFSLPSFYL